eukprot:1150293-Pelagomonas_calceolata.AAC.6
MKALGKATRSQPYLCRPRPLLLQATSLNLSVQLLVLGVHARRGGIEHPAGTCSKEQAASLDLFSTSPRPQNGHSLQLSPRDTALAGVAVN